MSASWLSERLVWNRGLTSRARQNPKSDPFRLAAANRGDARQITGSDRGEKAQSVPPADRVPVGMALGSSLGKRPGCGVDSLGGRCPAWARLEPGNGRGVIRPRGMVRRSVPEVVGVIRLWSRAQPPGISRPRIATSGQPRRWCMRNRFRERESKGASSFNGGSPALARRRWASSRPRPRDKPSSRSAARLRRVRRRRAFPTAAMPAAGRPRPACGASSRAEAPSEASGCTPGKPAAKPPRRRSSRRVAPRTRNGSRGVAPSSEHPFATPVKKRGIHPPISLCFRRYRSGWLRDLNRLCQPLEVRWWIRG